MLGKDADERRGEVRQPTGLAATDDEPAAAGRPVDETTSGDSAATPAEPRGEHAGASRATGDGVRRESAAPARPARARNSASAVRERQLRGLIAAILGLFLLGVALSRLFASPHGTGTATAPPTAAPTPPPAPTSPAGLLASIETPPVMPLTVLGSAAKMNLPREAVALPNGFFAIADTGNSRLLILDATGHVAHVTRRAAAPLQQPFALATLGRQIVVLDAGRGALDLFDDAGGFVRQIVVSPQLVDARGLSIGPHDSLYVANPRSNSIVAFSLSGRVERTFGGPLSAAPGGFNQPSDIAVAGDGTLYVLDNQNKRIEALSPSGHFLRQWPTTASDTVFSVHVLPLPDGRILASDPMAALFVYPAAGGQPRRSIILMPANQPPALTSPLGLSLLPNGRVLVTDDHGGRLLIVRIPARTK